MPNDRSPEGEHYIDDQILNKLDEGLQMPNEIADEIERRSGGNPPPQYVHTRLQALIEKGEVRKMRRGHYMLTDQR